jgi:hypothetical protein
MRKISIVRHSIEYYHTSLAIGTGVGKDYGEQKKKLKIETLK